MQGSLEEVHRPAVVDTLVVVVDIHMLAVLGILVVGDKLAAGDNHMLAVVEDNLVAVGIPAVVGILAVEDNLVVVGIVVAGDIPVVVGIRRGLVVVGMTCCAVCCACDGVPNELVSG